MLSNKLTLYYSKKWGKRGGRNILNMKQATLFFTSHVRSCLQLEHGSQEGLRIRLMEAVDQLAPGLQRSARR